MLLYLMIFIYLALAAEFLWYCISAYDKEYAESVTMYMAVINPYVNFGHIRMGV